MTLVLPAASVISCVDRAPAVAVIIRTIRQTHPDIDFFIPPPRKKATKAPFPYKRKLMDLRGLIIMKYTACLFSCLQADAWIFLLNYLPGVKESMQFWIFAG
jgi:hypothetical protein